MAMRALSETFECFVSLSVFGEAGLGEMLGVSDDGTDMIGELSAGIGLESLDGMLS